MCTTVTVITVVRNAEDSIRDTIKSVLAQTYTDMEYIIVDGLSTDKSYEYVCQYDEAFQRKKVGYIHVSEKDNGIFDAMNKAVQMAEGQWVCFMNADDKFHDAEVLTTVFARSNIDSLTEYDVIYGDTVRISNGKGEFGRARPVEDIVLNMPFCHQSSFTRTERLRQMPFDLNYRVADYNFFLRLYRNGGKFFQVPVTIADYSLDGYSNQNKYKTYLGTVAVKHDLGMLNQYSLKQQLKNLYFKALLMDDHPFHGLVRLIDGQVSRRKN